ncbi:MAG: hypothetical protein PHU63_01730 [Candidatus ainarchaeum sp.]|nr:hypothetical protein [Candidatus ainarchaeum sp.]
MRKIILLFLILLFSLSFSQSFSDMLSGISSDYELFSRWQVLSILIILLSILLISLTYAAGFAFEMPDLKAWAKLELIQVLVSALLLMGLISFLFFFDGLFLMLVNSSGTGYTCVDDIKGCSAQIADQYIDGLVELARESSKSHTETIYDYSKSMGYRVGYVGHTLIWLPFLWSGFSMATSAIEILDVERLLIVIEYYNPIIASLYAQKFFVTHISYNVGPYLLVFGLLTRAFFATRKLGGLLIAIAVAVMFVFPIMYVFDALTLAVTAYGDNPTGITPAAVCPTECTDPIPIGYIKGEENKVLPGNEDQGAGVFSWDALTEKPSSYIGVLDKSVHPQYDSIYDVVLSGQEAKTTKGKTIAPCGWPENEEDSKGCPSECRGIPYPALSDTCNDPDVRSACDALPDVCKRNLVMDVNALEGVYLQQWEMCPDECKTIPALYENAGGDCGGVWRDYKRYTSGACGVDYWNSDSEANAKADSHCTGEFQSLFGSAPMEVYYGDFCCVGTGNDGECEYRGDGNYWKNWQSGASCNEDIKIWCCYVDPTEPCKNVDSRCRINYYEIDASGKKVLVMDGNDRVFPDYCSDEDIEKAETCPIPADINSPDAAYQSCIYISPKDTSNCAKCMFVDDPFTYTVPVIVDCPALCGEELSTPPSISSSDFAKQASEGMYGKEDIKSVSGFMLPAYLLPLFNILVTVMFIRTFSPLLGGDIEIPGLSKVF